MSALEQVDRHEYGEQIHVGRVELEVHIGRAEVVAGRHESDHKEGEAHRVEEGERGAGSCLNNVCSWNLQSQLKNSWPAALSGWFYIYPLQFSPQDRILLHEGDQEEEQAKIHVAHITQDVIPHGKA